MIRHSIPLPSVLVCLAAFAATSTFFANPVSAETTVTNIVMNPSSPARP